MKLAIIDWLIILAYLLISLYIGLKYREKAGKSLSDFFLGGRNLPWYIAGLSMVATTFAADTPLAVTELVSKNGISGNWLWWNMLIGGMLTTFFFANPKTSSKNNDDQNCDRIKNQAFFKKNTALLAIGQSVCG